MNHRKLLLATITLLSVVVYFSCRKTEKVFTQPKTESETKFFTLPASADPSVQKVVDKIRRQNEASSFLNEFIKKQGFAVWDKATVQHVANSVATKSSRTANDSADSVIIPLVRANEKKVHGALACTIIDDKVTIRLLDGSKYNWYNQHPEITGNNGEQLSLMLMQLDKTVFGHELFKITDPTAFNAQKSKKPRYIKLLPTQGKAIDQRWVVETVTVTYVTYEDQFEGQLHGCAPGPDCFEYNAVTHTIVYQHYVWVDDPPNPDPWYNPNGGGGGGGTGGGGSNGNGETPWVPVGGTYQLTANDIRAWNQIEQEDAAADLPSPLDCHGTGRLGNANWSGTLEHWIIQLDYLSQNIFNAEREYKIPFAGPSGLNAGYADIVNKLTGEIFEIKPPAQVIAGADEVDNYVKKANLHCTGNNGPLTAVWAKGLNYPTRYLPSKDPTKFIKAELSTTNPGVIVYTPVDKSTVPQPPPIVVPLSVLDKLKELVRRLKQNIPEFQEIIAQYMSENPDLVNYIKSAAIGAAIGIIVGTIIEDFATLGGGILDDIPSFTLAYKIVRFAWTL
jgi:hypothetical protein